VVTATDMIDDDDDDNDDDDDDDDLIGVIVVSTSHLSEKRWVSILAWLSFY
jgi:hypothetical protein